MRQTIKDLPPITNYAIQARSVKDGQFSDWSPITYFTTDGDPTPPGNVTNLVATAGYDQINLTWDIAERADYYKVYQGSTSSNITNFIGITSSNSLTYSTLAWTTDNFFKVTAVSAFDVESLVPAVTTVAVRPKSSLSIDTDAPAAVTGATVTDPPAGFSPGATLTWTRNTETDMDRYMVRWSTSSTGPWNDISVPQNYNPTVTQTINVKLPAPGNYYFQIKPQDNMGNRPAAFVNFSPSPYAATGNLTAPAAVGAIVFFDGFNSISMTWPESAEPDVKWGAGQYQVEVDGYATAIAATTAASTLDWSANTDYKTLKVGANGATVSGLKANYFYNIRVRAINSSGTPGAWSAVVTDNLGSPVDDVPLFSIPADKFSTNLLVTSNITLNQDTGNGRFGYIQSSDYGGSDPNAGFRLGATGLDIKSGSINARALVIQDSANIMPAIYTDFELKPSAYVGNIVTPASPFQIDSVHYFFGSQCLYVPGNNSFVYLAPSASVGNALAYNIDVTPGETYILSWWTLATSTAATMSPAIRQNTGGDVFPSATGNGPGDIINMTTSWVRYTRVFSTNASRVGLYFNLGGSTDIYIDGIQIERKIAGSNQPSQWKSPSYTTIDGGAIRTGSLASTGTINIDGSSPNEPLWSLNMGGGLVVNDALVRGKLIVGTASGISNTSKGAAPALSTNANTGIYSSNWSGAVATPSTGARWAILGDGSFNLRSGTGTQGFTFDANKLTGNDGTTNTYSPAYDMGETFRLDSAGGLFLAGDIKAKSLDVQGAVISGDATVTGTLVGAKIKTALANQRTEILSSGFFHYDINGNADFSLGGDGVTLLKTGTTGSLHIELSNTTEPIKWYTGDYREQTPGKIYVRPWGDGSGPSGANGVVGALLIHPPNFHASYLPPYIQMNSSPPDGSHAPSIELYTTTGGSIYLEAYNLLLSTPVITGGSTQFISLGAPGDPTSGSFTWNGYHVMRAGESNKKFVQGGTFNYALSGGGASTYAGVAATVTFAALGWPNFSSPPVVICTPNTIGDSIDVVVTLTAVTTTGFNYRVVAMKVGAAGNIIGEVNFMCFGP